jgi:8-oxo-dGTP pyrophosphatase MutT (NUDIX family)
VDADALRARLRAAPGRELDPAVIAIPASGDDVRELLHDAPIPAAVLVPFVLGPAPGVLLTKRALQLSAHAGQVSFPGGRIELADGGAEQAALREAEEEIGLSPRQVEVVGRLPDYLTGTGFQITPVLGLLPWNVPLDELGLRPSAAEVESVFELSLAVLLDPDAPQRRRAKFKGRWREFWVWPHPEHYIWGATAGILVDLAARLRGRG